MIEIDDIMAFVDYHENPMKGSREILQSEYLQKIGVVKETDADVHIRGLCIQVSHPNQYPFQMDAWISKPFPGVVIKGKCQCDGGSTGKCKHSVAMLRCLIK